MFNIYYIFCTNSFIWHSFQISIHSPSNQFTHPLTNSSIHPPIQTHHLSIHPPSIHPPIYPSTYPPPIYPSTHPSTYPPPTYPTLHPSTYPPPSTHPKPIHYPFILSSIDPTIHLPIHLSIIRSVHHLSYHSSLILFLHPFCSSIRRPILQSVHLSYHPSLILFIHPSTHPTQSVHLSYHPSLILFIHLSIHPTQSVHPSILPSISHPVCPSIDRSTNECVLCLQLPLPGVQRLGAVLAVLPAVPQATVPAVPGPQPAPGGQGAGRHRRPGLRVARPAHDVR